MFLIHASSGLHNFEHRMFKLFSHWIYRTSWILRWYSTVFRVCLANDELRTMPEVCHLVTHRQDVPTSLAWLPIFTQEVKWSRRRVVRRTHPGRHWHHPSHAAPSNEPPEKPWHIYCNKKLPDLYASFHQDPHAPRQTVHFIECAWKELILWETQLYVCVICMYIYTHIKQIYI